MHIAVIGNNFIQVKHFRVLHYENHGLGNDLKNLKKISMVAVNYESEHKSNFFK